MEIEIINNSMKLPHRGLFQFSDSHYAEKRLRRFVDEKYETKGYKLRFIARHETSCIELQSDSPERYRMAVRFLEDAGVDFEEINWVDNDILQKIIRKDYKQNQSKVIIPR